jgi:hypothetical protein
MKFRRFLPGLVSRFSAPSPSSPIAALGLALLAALFTPHQARAVSYASSLTNDAGVVSFRLNEPADNVKVVSGGGAVTNDLGALGAGVHTFNLGIAGVFQVAVFKVSGPGFLSPVAPNRGAVQQIGADTVLTRFTQPRGLVVNTDPASPLFGRVYVANGAAGTTTNGVFGSNRTLGDGIYMLNSDLSDAIGQVDTPLTGGLDFATGGTVSPYRLSLGQDGNLYVTDWSDAAGSLYVTDPNVSPGTGANVLGGPIGGPFPVTTTRFHGSIAAAVVEGSLAGGDLKAFVIDEDLQSDPANGTATMRNSLWRHDIGGALPGPEALPTLILSAPWINFVSQTMDLSRGTNGYFYVNNNRSVGTDRAGVYVVDAAGMNLWNSLSTSLGMGFANDLLRATGGGAVSRNQSHIAVINFETNGITVVPLIDGIPDLTNRLVFHGFNFPGPQGRDVAFDAAGNLYAISQGAQALRVFSPGGTATAITGSDGAFTVIRPPKVSVTSPDPDSSEAGDSATFTITRDGDTSAALTVNVTFSGTATNGLDYNLPLTAVIPATQASVDVTFTPLSDAESEFLETVVLSLGGSAEYDLGAPTAATAVIIDDNVPVLTITRGDTNAYERTPEDTFTFILTRAGRTNSEHFVEYLLGGTATENQDFVFFPFPLYIPPGAVTTVITNNALDDAEYEGAESITLTIVPQVGDIYEVGAPDTATIFIRDDEDPPACRLFEDSLDTPASALNWTQLFGASNGVYDADVQWGFDYSAMGIPPAPGSPLTTAGLFVQVNKTNSSAGGAAGLNLYPNGRSFSGNYALRFDLYLSIGSAATTEHALAGLNHSGLLTNRVSQSANGTNSTRGNDGVWIALCGDAGNNLDWAAYSSTGPTNTPFLVTNRTPASLTQFFLSPPYRGAGGPGNADTSGTKTWAEVELSQINNIVSLRVNHALIYSFSNRFGFTSGNIMLGYNDQFDSVGTAGSFALFDNVRVVGLDFVIKSIQFAPVNKVRIDFTSPLGGLISEFRLECADDLAPSPVNWVTVNTATFTPLPGGDGFRAETDRAAGPRFYRIRR